MRQAIRANPDRRAVSLEESIPSPDQGWDAVSPLNGMDIHRAIILDNFNCRPGYVELRKGYFLQSSGLGGSVESLMVYRTTLEKMFGVANGTIWDCSVAGVAVATTVTGLSNNRFQYANFTTVGGSYITAVNGGDTPKQYDGTTWTDTTMTGAGLSVANLIDVMSHKRRLYYVENNTLSVWFLPITAITGTLVKFDLGPIFTEGGTLECVGTWTFDGGNGVDDYAVFITSQGQVAIYQGDDPTLAASWALVGVYSIGFPLSRRSVLKTGGDLAIITSDGIVPLSVALRTDRAAAERISLSARIQNEFAKSVINYKANFGWEGISYPTGNQAIFNIPTVNGVQSQQYVVNVLTGGWSRWKGQNAFCWTIFNDFLYFGAAGGFVYQADKGSIDGSNAITADLKTAFNYFREKNRLKHFKMIRPIIKSNGTVMPAVEIDVDYKEAIPTATPTVIAPTGIAIWDVSLWDVGLWGSDEIISNDFTSVTGIGICGAARMRIVSTGGSSTIPVTTTAQIIGFDIIYSPGGYF